MPPRSPSGSSASGPRRPAASSDPSSVPAASPVEPTDASWVVPPELDRKPLDAAVRLLGELTWGQARQLIGSGKIQLAGEQVRVSTRPVRAGQAIELRLRAPRPAVARALQAEGSLVVYVDASVVVVRKPAGISTLAYGDEAPEEQAQTLDVLVRDVVARRDRIRGRAPLGIVHRLDKTTSGLLVFARTLAAKKHLAAQFREHSVHRVYQAIAHGKVRANTIRSHLVVDRGDGLRGSARPGQREGQLAITHVEPLQALRGATLVSCRLETGRTHQIRIHLSEAGHPIVGEKVYVRRYPGTLLPAGRAMLHAAELGFVHPVTEEELRFQDPPPPDFEEMLRLLREAPAAP